MLDCEGAMRPKAGLVKRGLLINVSEKKLTGKMSGKLQGRKKRIINQPKQSLAEICASISVLQRKKGEDY